MHYKLLFHCKYLTIIHFCFICYIPLSLRHESKRHWHWSWIKPAVAACVIGTNTTCSVLSTSTITPVIIPCNQSLCGFRLTLYANNNTICMLNTSQTGVTMPHLCNAFWNEKANATCFWLVKSLKSFNMGCNNTGILMHHITDAKNLAGLNAWRRPVWMAPKGAFTLKLLWRMWICLTLNFVL